MANPIYTGYQSNGNVVAIPQLLLDKYSMEIEHLALPQMRFEEFAVHKDDFTKGDGDTIIFTRFSDIEGGGPLQESKPLTETNAKASQYSVTVTEYGNAIGVTEKMLQLSMIDVLKEYAILLGRNYSRTVDRMLRDVVLSTSHYLYAGGRDDRSELVGGTDYFDVECVRNAVEILQTNDAPMFNNDFYVCMLSAHQVASVKRDPEWVAAHNYANDRALFTGELGRWDNVIFVQTSQMKCGTRGRADYDATLTGAAKGGATPADVFVASIFGDNAYGIARALPVELRQKIAEDYGRKHGLAWYSIMAGAMLNEDYIIRVETV